MQLHQAQSRIERILRDNLYIRRTLATSGALEFNRLARYRTSKRVFTRKTEQSGKLYNFIILVDVSWSMENCWRYSKAMTAAQNVAKLLRHIANVEFRCFNYLEYKFTCEEMIALHISSARYNLFKVKCWAKTINGKHYICRADDINIDSYPDNRNTAFSSSTPRADDDRLISHCGNREVCNLVSARKDIRRKEWHNVIIIIQDWLMSIDDWRLHDHPVCFAWQEMSKYTKENYKDTIRKIEHDVELVSMGVNIDTPEKFFSNFMYIKDASDIYPSMIKIFERLITNW